MVKLALILLFCATSVLADVVVLDNGDRITGKILKKDGDAVSLKSDLLGEVSVKWAHVASLTTDEPVTVVLPSGQSVQGRVTTTEKELQVATTSGTQSATLATVKEVRGPAEQARYERYLHPPWTDLWAGFFDLGYAATRGNSRTTVLTTSLNANRITRHDKTAIYFNQIYSRARIDNQSVLTARAIRSGWAYNRDIHPRVFLNLFNDYETDRFQNLKLRVVAGAGAGVHVFKTERALLDLLGGGAFNRENYRVALANGENSRNSGEAYWGDDFNYRISGLTSLKQAFRMFNNLSDTGQYRMNFDLGTDTKLGKWLAWQLTISDRYISNPSPGRLSNDLLVSTGLRISFAQGLK